MNNDSPHLEYKQRWVNQFNFYLNDARWGRMFVRMCPYFPFSARVCLNQHHWLAICVAFLKLFEKIYAPLTAGLLAPFRGDRVLADEKRCELDRLYQRVCDDLDSLLRAVGLRVAA